MTKAKIDYAALSLDDVVSPSEMTVGQIITEFRQAKDRKYTLQALADQVCCTVDDMKELLISHGVKPVEMPRARRKKEPVENFRGGWRALHPIRNRLPRNYWTGLHRRNSQKPATALCRP